MIDELERMCLPSNLVLRKFQGDWLSALEIFPEFDRVIIVDSVETGARPGTVLDLDVSALPAPPAAGYSTRHELDLPAALDLGRRLSIPLPSDIRIIGIEASDTQSFSESISPQLSSAVTGVSDLILRTIDSDGANSDSSRSTKSPR